MRGKLHKVVEWNVEPGKKRVITRFLFLPLTLPIGERPGDLLQWRWLERARIRQRIEIDEQMWPEPLGFWEDVCWAD